MRNYDFGDAITNLNVIFDDKFRKFHTGMLIAHASHIPASQMTDLSANCYDLIDKQQSNIRDYIIKYQNDLSIENNRKLTCNDMPELFAISISLLVNIDSCYNFQDIFLKIRSESLIIEDDEIEIVRDQQCICGHGCKLKNVFLIINSITDKIAMVGCDCILKKRIIESSIIDEAIKKRNAKLRKHKAKLENKICIECDKILRKNDKEPICNSCIKKKEKEAKIPRCLECQCVLKTNKSKCLNCKIDIPIAIATPIILNSIIYTHAHAISDNYSLRSNESDESFNTEDSDDIYLYVPFKEKEKAKRCGAIWDSNKKMWCCRSKDFRFCNEYKIIYLDVPFEMKDEFKFKYESQWDSIVKKWYINQKIYEKHKLFFDDYLYERDFRY